MENQFESHLEKQSDIAELDLEMAVDDEVDTIIQAEETTAVEYTEQDVQVLGEVPVTVGMQNLVEVQEYIPSMIFPFDNLDNSVQENNFLRADTSRVNDSVGAFCVTGIAPTSEGMSPSMHDTRVSAFDFDDNHSVEIDSLSNDRISNCDVNFIDMNSEGCERSKTVTYAEQNSCRESSSSSVSNVEVSNDPESVYREKEDLNEFKGYHSGKRKFTEDEVECIGGNEVSPMIIDNGKEHQTNSELELNEEELEIEVVYVDSAYSISSNSNDSSQTEIQGTVSKRPHPEEPKRPRIVTARNFRLEDSSSTESETETRTMGVNTGDALGFHIQPLPVENPHTSILQVRTEKGNLHKKALSHLETEKYPRVKNPHGNFVQMNELFQNESSACSLKKSHVSTDTQPSSNEYKQNEKNLESDRFSAVVPAVNKSPKQCLLCLKHFCDELNLKKHILWHLLLKNSGENKLVDPLRKEEFDLGFLDLDIRSMSFDQLFELCGPQVRGIDSIYCMFCKRNFEFHHDLSVRMKLVDIQNNLVCARCNKSFDKLMSLEIHLRQHFGSKPFGCCCCEQVFSDIPQLKSHLLIHTFHSYGKCKQCRYCSKISFSLFDEHSHESDHHLISYGLKLVWETRNNIATMETRCSNRKMIELSRMFQNSKSAGEIIERISKYHKQNSSGDETENLLDRELVAVNSMRTFNAEILNFLGESKGPCSPRTSASLEDMNAQLAVYKQVITSSYGSILDSIDKKKCWCRYCGKSFADVDDLCLHKDMYHEAPKLFSCQGCSRYFGSFKALSDHRITHINRFPSQCPVCFEWFDFRFDMSQHLKIHFADRLKQCPECGLKYSLQSYLVEHLQTHPELRSFMYKCKECCSMFTNKTSLNKHVRQRHFCWWSHECSICGKHFFKAGALSLHWKGHMRNRYRKNLKRSASVNLGHLPK